MRLALRVIKLSIADLVEEIFLLIVFNVLWSLSALLVLPLPFATAGLTWVAAEIGEGKAIKLSTFFEGGRRYWKPAYLWGLANLISWSLIALSLNFYASLNVTWGMFLRSLVVALALVWGGAQLYVFPLLILQKAPSLRRAYRDGLILMASQPALTVVVWVLAAALLLLSVILTVPLFMLYFAFIALLGNRAVVETLKARKP